MHHASLLRTLRQQPQLLPVGCRVLLAVSGGQVGERQQLLWHKDGPTHRQLTHAHARSLL